METTLLRPASVRLDLLPSAIGIPIALGAAFVGPYAGSDEAYGVLLVACVVGILTFLACEWSTGIKARLRYAVVAAPNDAQHVRVVPDSLMGGRQEIVPMQKVTRPGLGEAHSIVFQQQQYFFDDDSRSFVPMEFPDNNTFGDYLSATGLSDAEAEVALPFFGANKFQIPFPTFMDLYKEQALAPFFVFQVFCVGLWCLDEYWQYSLLTLVMLFVFEAVVVTTRRRNLQQIRKMNLAPHGVSAFREGRWRSIPSDQIVPGDIISLPRSDHPVPADVVLLHGTCIVNEAMLTGESTPQLKEPITNRAADDRLALEGDDLHIIFGGTSVVQVESEKSDLFKNPPGNGCVAFVIKTGFHTAQGSLVRTILYSTERVTANTLESFVFILFLLCFALVASGYVWTHGQDIPDQSTWKLLLKCTLIITSVVPPELPMELSLAVNTSLAALAKLKIFCTEPFRIPSAGRIDICCFDKTGTLTTEDLEVRGVCGIEDPRGVAVEAEDDGDGGGPPGATLIPASDVPLSTAFVMAGCHSLIFINGQADGDPMEKAMMGAMGWSLGKTGAVTQGSHRVLVLHRNHFSSELKRMSTVAACTSGGSKRTVMALVKGAPEVLASHFANAPPNYGELHRHHARQGSRVLALGYKELPSSVTSSSAKNVTRDEAESGLTFAGFLIFHCPLKLDTAQAMERIVGSSHRPVMITGDSPLTACHVASELAFTAPDKTMLILQVDEDGDGPAQWVSIDESETHPLTDDKASLRTLITTHDLCLTGPGIDHLQARSEALWAMVCPCVKVFARVSPNHKALVVLTLRSAGYTTLMCGDGTNDVGALKKADVGISLLSISSETLKKIQDLRERREAVLAEASPDGDGGAAGVGGSDVASGSGSNVAATRARKLDKLKSRKKGRGGGSGGSGGSGSGGSGASGGSGVSGGAGGTNKTLAQRLDELQKESEEVEVVKLGDASVASPFTARSSSLNAVVQIIRQGRCTLVTTLQMYKILALNCLITAYSLSVLYLEGVKFGDTQMTVSGMLIALCFLFISRSKPKEHLSKERPEANIFTAYFFVSILGQFAVHLYCLIQALTFAQEQDAEAAAAGRADLDGDFEPTFINSVIFLVSLTMQVSTFAINYRGHPFMDSLTENRVLLMALGSTAGLTAAMGTGLFPDLNEYFELVSFGSPAARNQVLVLMGLDFFGAFAVETVSKFLLLRTKPRIATY